MLPITNAVKLGLRGKHGSTIEEKYDVFTVTVAGPNNVTLRTSDKLYLQDSSSENEKELLIAATNEEFWRGDYLVPDPSSYFTVEQVAGNTIRFKGSYSAYWCTYYDYYKKDKKATMISKKQPDETCDFTVVKQGTDCKDTVLKMNFHLSPLGLATSPEFVTSHTLTNNSPIEQEQLLEISKEVITTTTFTWGHHFAISSETTMQINIPFIASGKLMLRTEAGFRTGGKASSTTIKKFKVIVLLSQFQLAETPCCCAAPFGKCC